MQRERGVVQRVLQTPVAVEVLDIPQVQQRKVQLARLDKDLRAATPAAAAIIQAEVAELVHLGKQQLHLEVMLPPEMVVLD
jgi:ABC-type phosphate transport system substrate-binding protein